MSPPPAAAPPLLATPPAHPSSATAPLPPPAATPPCPAPPLPQQWLGSRPISSTRVVFWVSYTGLLCFRDASSLLLLQPAGSWFRRRSTASVCITLWFTFGLDWADFSAVAHQVRLSVWPPSLMSWRVECYLIVSIELGYASCGQHSCTMQNDVLSIKCSTRMCSWAVAVETGNVERCLADRRLSTLVKNVDRFSRRQHHESGNNPR